MPELSAKALIQKWRLALGPAPDGDVIYRQLTLRHHFLHVPVAQRITQVPPDAQKDDDVLVVSPAEQHWPVLAHRITLPTRGCCLQQILTLHGTSTGLRALLTFSQTQSIYVRPLFVVGVHGFRDLT
jgi:hypothetical protein